MTPWQKVRFYLGANALLKRLGVPRKERRLVMRKFLKGVQWVNLGVFALGILNNATQTFPALQTNMWVTGAQLILAALLPSAGGISHKLASTEVVPKG